MQEHKRETLEEKQARVEKAKQQGEAFKVASQRLWTTPDGQLIAKAMMRACGVYNPDKSKIENQAGKEWMYLVFIKGILTPEQCMLIERPEEMQ